MYLPAGYVKLEGATVNRSNYPRLVALADNYNLWTSDTTANPGLFGEGDGTDTMVLPNWTGRMAQFAATAGSAVAAGLPNITGAFAIVAAQRHMGVNALNGAFVNGATETTSNVNQSATSNYAGSMTIDASRSNLIYSASTTVQPPAINTFAIMRY